jgi:DNA polymerase-4
MNSYFASVEQQANPFLRGRSVGVCAYLSPGGVIIASSQEAKARGIKTGCTVRDAKVLDPSVILVENEPAKYRSVTEKVFGILRQYSDAVEPYSIDEAFVDLTGWAEDFERAHAMALEIKNRITNEVGEWLGCSIGLSWTKFLAKFAGDLAPKRGVLIIDSEAVLREILHARPLTDAWGINTRLEAHLKAIGINDLGELKDFNQAKIKHILGLPGYYLWANVNGLEINRVHCGSQAAKSIGHSYCPPQKTTDKKYLSAILYKLCEKTGRRLRNSEQEAQRIHIGWSYAGQGGLFKSFKTSDKMFTTEEIFKQAGCFLEKETVLASVRMLAVSVSLLTPVSSQMSLFENKLAKKNLSRALDKINNKYGEYTVVKGAMFGTDDVAKDRIGFRKTN